MVRTGQSCIWQQFVALAITSISVLLFYGFMIPFLSVSGNMWNNRQLACAENLIREFPKGLIRTMKNVKCILVSNQAHPL